MQLDHLWKKTCEIFSDEVSADVADTWLSQLTAVSFTCGTLAISGSDRARSWVGLRYRRALTECASDAAGEDIHVELIAEDQSRDDRVCAPTAIDSDSDPTTPPISNTLNPRFTFDQFVIGRANHDAHAAALAVAEQPAQAFNPLFVYGNPGVGKTHLLHAIGNYISNQAPELTARYMTAEDFASVFRRVIRDGTIGDFKHTLRQTDVLLVDDIQFLQNKLKTEEEFFHTINSLHETGRQLVISCDRTPRELSKLEARLRERFEAGLVVEVEPPDLGLRSGILGRRIHTDQIPIDDDAAVTRIAERSPANVRSLEGALVRVSALSSLRRQPVTAKLVDELLDAIHPGHAENCPAKLSIAEPVVHVELETICAVVANHFQVTPDELAGRNRSRLITGPRQIAMYLGCQMTELTLPRISKHFNRDHSTVVHARDKVRSQLTAGDLAATVIDSLKQEIHNRSKSSTAQSDSQTTQSVDALLSTSTHKQSTPS